MKGRKCSLIFMRKVANRLTVLEERYKDLPPKARAGKINEELMSTFCVEEREIRRWKSIATLMQSHADNIDREPSLPPSHYIEIARLPEEKQKEVIDEATSKKLTYQQTALLVQKVLGSNEFTPQIYNVWNFNGCDEQFGLNDFEGRIPGQLIQNVLYYFTKENDVVVDPMAGSGTTYDVCLAMNRKPLCYDLRPTRKEVVQHDIRKGYPPEAKDCDLIFLDPPYFNMVFGDYSKVEDFYLFLDALAVFSHDTVKESGIVSFLMQDMTEKGNYCLSGDGYRIFRKRGFDYVSHVSCPLTTEQFLPQQVLRAKSEKRMLGRNRDLYIFRREN